MKQDHFQKGLLQYLKDFKKFHNSILVISYRDDGIPTTKELVEILKKMGKEVEVKKTDYKYVLSNGKSREVLMISQ